MERQQGCEVKFMERRRSAEVLAAGTVSRDADTQAGWLQLDLL